MRREDRKLVFHTNRKNNRQKTTNKTKHRKEEEEITKKKHMTKNYLNKQNTWQEHWKLVFHTNRKNNRQKTTNKTKHRKEEITKKQQMTKKVINKTILDRKAGNWFAIPAGKITKLFLASKCVSFAIICKITHQDIGSEFHFYFATTTKLLKYRFNSLSNVK